MARPVWQAIQQCIATAAPLGHDLRTRPHVPMPFVPFKGSGCFI